MSSEPSGIVKMNKVSIIPKFGEHLIMVSVHISNQEVKDGHVNDAEESVAAVVRVDLLDCVTVKGVELPPEGEKKSWGWKSQDARVLGALSILSPHSQIPASPSLPWPRDLRMSGGWLASSLQEDPG